MLLKNIFLSEDDPDDVEFFQFALSQISESCSLTVSYNGEEFLSQVKSADDAPDIIFLDVNMPKVNGLEALKVLRQEENLKDIPVIVYSTTSNDFFINDAHKLGADYYFIKPSDPSALRDRIKQLLSFNWAKRAIPTAFSDFVLSGI